MKLNKEFYMQDVLKAAPALLGKLLCRKLPNDEVLKYRITETEAYCGSEDTACHAKVGKTPRTEIMFREGGCAYIYMIYGLHYLLNVVTGEKDNPQAVLIRRAEGWGGPAKLTKAMRIDKSLNGANLCENEIWIEDDGYKAKYKTDKRVGIDYASEYYKNINWRFIMI